MFLFLKDRERLTSIVALDRVFGRRSWCWEELPGMGLTLNREEARAYLEGADPGLPSDREALYELLFDEHSELKLSVFSPEELVDRLEKKLREKPEPIFAGVDVGKDQFFACVLDLADSTTGPKLEFAPIALDLESTVKWLLDHKASVICIDGPPFPNRGVLGERLPENCKDNRYRRVAEFQLGIGGCYATPIARPTPDADNSWMASSFDLFDSLSRCMDAYIDLGDGKGALIETYPTYAFKALLGRRESKHYGIQKYRLDPDASLKPKRTKEGKLQRMQLLEQSLERLGVQATDSVRAAWNRSVDWIDASICAVVAAQRSLNPDDVLAIGDAREGAIYLHIPKSNYLLETANTPPKHDVADNVADDARENAVIFRLGENGPGGMSQQDTVDTAILAADREGLWIPVDSSASFNLDENLQAVGGTLYLAFGDRLVLQLSVDKCVQDRSQRSGYPGKFNPWSVEESYGWVRVSRLIEVNIGPGDFLVRHGDTWKHGYPNQSALLRAIVHET